MLRDNGTGSGPTNSSVVLLTDGDGGSRLKDADVEGLFQEDLNGRRPITLDIIAFGPPGCTSVMLQLANRTGGSCYAASESDPGQLLKQVLGQSLSGVTLMVGKRAAVAGLACLILLGCAAQPPPWPQDSSEAGTSGSSPVPMPATARDLIRSEARPECTISWPTGGTATRASGPGSASSLSRCPVAPPRSTARDRSAAQSRDAQYDIYNLDSQWVNEFATGGYISSLAGQAIDTSGFVPKPLASAKGPSGELYALPFTTDVGLLYYRSNLVQRSQLDALQSFRTFRDLMGLARSVAAAPIPPRLPKGTPASSMTTRA